MEPIINYEGLYEIHLNKNDGSGQPGIFSVKRKIYMIPELSKNGYLRVKLTKDKEKQWQSIHRLVATHFINNPDNLPTIDHINKNTQDNSLGNLRWFSRSFQELNKVIIPKGYSFDKRRKKYRVRVKRDGKLYYGGLFVTEESAKVRAKELYKEIYHDFPDLSIWD